MSMNVIDIASYQAALDLDNINFDGVAIKATEGTGYINPYCDTHYQEAKRRGKKRAVYHFYDFGLDPIDQANYFVNNCMGYIRDAIFVLDWEGSGVENVGDALKFLQQVEARIGYKPAIYMSEWVENTYDWSAVVDNNNGLWAAKYSNWELQNHAHDWDMSNAGQAPTVTHWPFYFMWQWTSTGLLNGYAGDLDCDIALIDGDEWDKYAGVPEPETTTTTTTEAPTTTEATTAAPVEPEPTTTEAPAATTTTTGAPAEVTTTTATPEVTGVTTTETPASGKQQAWLAVVWSLILYVIERLQGKRK